MEPSEADFDAIYLNSSGEGVMEDALETMRVETMTLWFTQDMMQRHGEFPDLDHTHANAMPFAAAAFSTIEQLTEDEPDMHGIYMLLHLASELKLMAAIHYTRQMAKGLVEQLQFADGQS